MSTYVFGMFRIDRCRKKIIISVPLPATPTTKIMLKRNGTMYVSGRSLYGVYCEQSLSSHSWLGNSVVESKNVSLCIYCSKSILSAFCDCVDEIQVDYYLFLSIFVLFFFYNPIYRE